MRGTNPAQSQPLHPLRFGGAGGHPFPGANRTPFRTQKARAVGLADSLELLEGLLAPGHVVAPALDLVELADAVPGPRGVQVPDGPKGRLHAARHLLQEDVEAGDLLLVDDDAAAREEGVPVAVHQHALDHRLRAVAGPGAGAAHPPATPRLQPGVPPPRGLTAPHWPGRRLKGRETDKPGQSEQRPSAQRAPRGAPRAAALPAPSRTSRAAGQSAPPCAPHLLPRARRSPGVTTGDSGRVGAGRRGGGALGMKEMKLNFSHPVGAILCKQLNSLLAPSPLNLLLALTAIQILAGITQIFSLPKNERQRCVERQRKLERPGQATPPPQPHPAPWPAPPSLWQSSQGHLLNPAGGAWETEAGLGDGVVPSDAEVPWGWDTERGGGSAGSAVASEARPVTHTALPLPAPPRAPLTPLGPELLVPAVSIATAAALGAGLVDWA